MTRTSRRIAAIAIAALLGVAVPVLPQIAVAASATHESTRPVGYLDRPRAVDAAALFPDAAAPPVNALADDGTHAIVVIGELDGAQHVAVLVPGMGRNRANLGLTADGTVQPVTVLRAEPGGDLARGASQYRQMAQLDADRVAVVVFLGYTPPQDDEPLTVLSTDRAKTGVAPLIELQRRIRAATPRAHVTWVCHSYGSLVCAGAASALEPTDDLVFIGSPGTGAASAADLGPARVWAGLGTRDPIALVGIASDLSLSELGTPPTDPAFGARQVSLGAAGHSDYFEPGSRSVRALAAIAAGQAPEGDGASSGGSDSLIGSGSGTEAGNGVGVGTGTEAGGDVGVGRGGGAGSAAGPEVAAESGAES